ncbi:hypothetical protein AnigIFM50267_004735 [Aspergillus niger]|uniref:Uncharacterized protein n=1 Tax=Aspergillus welwitschiae TaxID=1341132 RepID=A0A3F3Q139_9EURO|nr:hypothetical protein BDQ94DRAFT_170639 [Aspergillus welwitschiae]RDH32943.1 hypothetical protein BDQ94DRAFT_170639 [Aspergillus welwitschiae]GKZ69524.1 hypothetical protein AnigIFM50267_004735 [Aspergillus niger]
MPKKAPRRIHSNVSLTAAEESDPENIVLRPLNNLHDLIRKMLYEVRNHESTVASLKTWAETIDPNTYRKQVPWPRELLEAYERYKHLVDLINPRLLAFKEYENRTSQPTKVRNSAEVRMKRLELALEWGQAALSAAEARIYVLVNYRNAYDDKRSIQSHIKQASDNSASAREAVRKAGQNYRAYWRALAAGKPHSSVLTSDTFSDGSD